MRLLDFVEQQHAMRMLVDAVGQQTALVEADIAGRRADQARDRVPLHVFRHVEADQLDAERGGQLLGDLGLADAGRTGEQIAADRLFRLAQAGARELDRGRQRVRSPCPGRRPRVLSVCSRCCSTAASSFDTVLGGIRAMVEIVVSISLMPMVFLRRLSGSSICAAPELVDHVDRLVRQFAVMDVARRQFDRRLDRLVGVFELVVFLEIGLQPFQDLDRILNRRLVDVDLLEPAHQRAVLLEILTVLFIGCRADAADRAGGERRLEQIRRVHRAAGGRAGADHGVDLVDEHDRAGIGLDLLDHLLEPFLEIAAIARAGEQRAHIEREHGGAFEHVGHFAVDDAARQTLGDRGLADAGIADEQRIVLLAAAEHLDRAVDLGVAADQRIDLAVACAFLLRLTQ